MSDEEHSEEEMEAEEAPEEEEVEAEPALKKPKDIPPPEGKELTETEAAILAAKKKHEEDDAQRMKEYEEQRKLQKEKEDQELAELKEKQERRRKEREEEEAMMAERMKAEEERRKQEEEERKKRMEADKAKKEAEKAKRQAMMQMQGAPGAAGGGGPNFVLPSQKQGDKFEKLGNIMQAKGEMGLTKEQLEEQKRKMLAEHVKPLSLEGMDVAAIRAKVKELHDRVCKLEAETYDLEKRRERQDYDLKEMNERQRLINRNKALRKGLDPDAESSRFPPKIPVASKFERQVDRRSYGDRRDLFENPKAKPRPKLFHGSVKPPTEWGRRDNEELEFIRKNLEPFKYVEQAPIEGAAPPMEPVPVSYEEDAGGEGEEGGEEEEEE